MNIIVIDDDIDSLDSLASALRLEGYPVKEFSDPVQAVREFEPETTGIVISDYAMPGMTGIDLIKEIHQKKPNLPVIIISGEYRRYIKNNCLKEGASAFFYKPINIKQVITKLKKLNI